MFRNIAAIVVAVILGGAANMALVTVSQIAYPYPESVDPNDMDQLRAYITEHGLPTDAFLIVLIAHSGGSFVSGFTCSVIVRRAWWSAAIGMALFWTAGGITMLTMIPAPLWFAVADIILYVPAGILGAWMSSVIPRTFNQDVAVPTPEKVG